MKQVRYFEDVKIILKELEETKKDVRDVSIYELRKELEIRKKLYIHHTPLWACSGIEDLSRNKAWWSNNSRIADIERQLNK